MKTPVQTLVQVLSDAAIHVGMADHSFIVGGAPRDFLKGEEVKDLDVVVERRGSKEATRLGEEVCRLVGFQGGCSSDSYGVVHIGPLGGVSYNGVSLKGQKIEIVTARREKYDRTRGKDSHKPVSVEPGTIIEDLFRRDFTINTLVWRLADLREGIESAPILDLLGSAADDLRAGRLRTPLDPRETFDDDPSRMLRAVRFAVKYGLVIDADVASAIRAKAEEIRRLPWEAIDPLFFQKILSMPYKKVRAALLLMDDLGLTRPVLEVIPEARMRRAVPEYVLEVRTVLDLALRGFNVGLPYTMDQFRSIQAHSMSDQDLETFLVRLRKPIVDVVAFSERHGYEKEEIQAALTTARDVLVQDPQITPDDLESETVRRMKERNT